MKFTKNTLQTRSLASGHELNIPVYTFDSEKEGPSVYIQSSIHGAEVQGCLVIHELMKNFSKEEFCGKATFVPLTNPYAANQKIGDTTLGRFEMSTGENYNRSYVKNWILNEGERESENQLNISIFVEENIQESAESIKENFKSLLLKSLENTLLSEEQWGVSYNRKNCARLQVMANQADIVLDLHTGPKSSRHLYCPEYAKESASQFNIPHTIIIPNEFAGALDEVSFCPWWDLQEAFAKAGRKIPLENEAFTVELGNQEEISLEAAKEDVASIMSYLAFKGVVSKERFSRADMTRHACLLKDYKTLKAQTGGVYEYLAQPEDIVKKGEAVVHKLDLGEFESVDGVEKSVSPIEVPEDAIVVVRATSSILHEGAELYKLMTNYFEM